MKRFRKIIKYLALGGLALIAILLLVNVGFNYTAGRRLEQKINALREAEQPVSLEDLAREAIPPDQNAATYLRRARPDVQAIQLEVTAAIEAAPKIEQDRFHEGMLSPSIKTAIQAAFAAYPKVVDLLEQAAAAPDYDSQLDVKSDPSTFMEGLLENATNARGVMRVLNYRALLQLSDGQQEQAVRTCLLMFRLCRHFDHEPTITSYLVTLACRSIAASTANAALRAGPLPDELRNALDAELELQDSVVPFQNALITERAYGLQSFRDLDDMMHTGPIGLPWIKNDACSYIDMCDDRLRGPVIPLPTRNSIWTPAIWPTPAR